MSRDPSGKSSHPFSRELVSDQDQDGFFRIFVRSFPRLTEVH